MSQYDKLSVDKKHREIKLTSSNQIVGAALSVMTLVSLWFYLPQNDRPLLYLTGIFAFFIIGLVASFVCHLIRIAISSAYRSERAEIRRIGKKMQEMKAQVDLIYRGYPVRAKGGQFKKAYNLTGKNVKDIERTLAVAMFKEEKEVFVTAFVRRGIAVRVTAAIGSRYRCVNADNPKKWAEHFERLGCDEIRQYHNHPATNNSTSPSDQDYKSTRALKKLLGRQSDNLKSFIIFWNEIKEWRILEYDEEPPHQVIYRFDVAA